MSLLIDGVVYTQLNNPSLREALRSEETKQPIHSPMTHLPTPIHWSLREATRSGATKQTVHPSSNTHHPFTHSLTHHLPLPRCCS